MKEFFDIEVVNRKEDLLGTLFTGEELELFLMSMVRNRSFLKILVLLRRQGKGLGAHQHFRPIAIGTGVQRDTETYMTRIEGEGWKEKRMTKKGWFILHDTRPTGQLVGVIGSCLGKDDAEHHGD